MKVLLVEDQADKRQAISKALVEVNGVREDLITHAADATTARRLLEKEYFDLLVLDIAIPMRADLDVDAAAGLRLLEEILDERREYYKTPAHVIGITAYEDLFEKVSGRFGGWLLTLVHFEAVSTSWIAAFQARVRHIAQAISAERDVEPDFGTDLGIVTALQSPEMDAVKDLPWTWAQTKAKNDHTIYWQGKTAGPGGAKSVTAATANRMGFAATGAICAKLIQHFRPRVLAMTGISAGVRGKVNFGDVIIADPCWDWGSGKWTRDDRGAVFLAAPHQVGLEPSIREKFASIAADGALLSRIRDEWQAEKPDTALKVHIGPFASGASVVADAQTLERVTSQHRQLLGLDMEAYSLMSVAQEYTSPRPLAVVVKGVVDFGDAAKDDRFRHYAAYASAQVMRAFAEI